ncbi:hypothetical protein [Parafrankia elaeagni]|uniref:hypothetical protein n=1 Tax=Parafrankia elaeagni TaxID=222534 RepID=UPI0003AA4FEB|nr:hypothetical protein [Parafrankia elaeagni]
MRFAELLLDARHAARAGDVRRAAELQSRAVLLIAGVHAESPADPRRAWMLGGVQYDLAAMRYRAGDPGAAVRALDASEQLYAVLVRRTPTAAGPLADVRARRAVVRATQGHGASALVDAQAALLGLRAAPDPLGRPDGRDDPGSARVLALCGDVLAAFGDPDLALAASDRAVRALLGPAVAAPAGTRPTSRFPAGTRPTGTFPTNRPGSPHPGYLARACRVAAVIRHARGPGQADRARRLAAAAAHLGAPPTSTLLEQRISSPLPPDLTLGLRGALRVAERRGGDPGTASSLLQALAAPETDGTPPGWSTDPTWHGRITAARPNGPTPVAAAACATMLGRLAGDILSASADPLVGLRLMLEAHCLRAAPAASCHAAPGEPADQAQAADPAWAGLLDTASRRIAAAGDPSFALDLASWAERARGGPARRPVAALDPQGATGIWQALPC